MEMADPSRLTFGSDFPFTRHRTPLQDAKTLITGFEAFDGWDAATRRGIESGNAFKLFPRLAQATARAS